MTAEITLSDNNTNFVKPYYIEELGEEGLTSIDIARSLGVSLGHVHEKLRRNEWTRSNWKMICYPIVKKVKNSNGTIHDHGSVRIWALATKAAKAFVARWASRIGDLYLEYLFDCEAVAEKLVPIFRAQIEMLEKQVLETKMMLPTPRKPHANKNTILVLAEEETFFGNEAVYRRIPRDSDVPELVKKEGKLKHLTTVNQGISAEINKLTKEIAKERMNVNRSS